MRLNEQYIMPFLDRGRYARLLSRAGECRDMLAGGGGLGSEYTGWLSLADGYDPAELERVERTAAKTGPKRICLSWSGSAARLWARSPRLNFYRAAAGVPEVLFAGNSLSPDALARSWTPARTGRSVSTSSPNPGRPPSLQPLLPCWNGLWRKNMGRLRRVGSLRLRTNAAARF